MEKTVDASDVKSSSSSTVEGEFLDNPETEVTQEKICKEKVPLLKKIIALKDFIERILLQVLLKSVLHAMLTDLVAVLSIIAKTTFWVLFKALYTMIAVPAKSTRNYFENERVLVIGGSSEIGKEIALQLARYNINRITLWDTDAEQLKEVADEIKQLKSSSKVFTYTLPCFSKESVQDTITEMKLEAGDVSVLVNAIDITTNTNEKILTAETNSLLNTIQQELVMYTLVRHYYK